jgi:hypothetical protein
MHNYESTHGGFPPNLVPGANFRYSAGNWGILAYLSPFMEQSNVYNVMNLNAPTYAPTPPYHIADPGNALAAGLIIPAYLCPGDQARSLGGAYGVAALGPASYCGNQGDGLYVSSTGAPANGSPYDSNGVTYANSFVRIAMIMDGTSNTACISERVLGTVNSAAVRSPQRDYGYLTTYQSSLTEAACAAPGAWNVATARQLLWYSGEIRNASYNHYYPPNARNFDCITNAFGLGYTAIGWKAARSMHTGGAQLLLCDGYLILRNVFSPAEMQRLQAACDRLLHHTPSLISPQNLRCRFMPHHQT